MSNTDSMTPDARPSRPEWPAIHTAAAERGAALRVVAIAPGAQPAGVHDGWFAGAGFASGVGDTASAPMTDGSMVLLAGVGAGVGDRVAATRFGAALVRGAGKADAIELDVAALGEVHHQGLVEGVLLASYRFDAYRGAARPVTLRTVHLVGIDPVAVDVAQHVAAGVCLARDLVNEPGSVLTPAEFGRRAEGAAAAGGFSVTIHGRASIEAMGMGGLLGINRGSANEPRFLELAYEPAGGDATGTVAVVGKGVTFDSGGLNTKNTKDMTRMKKDMAGAAAVLGLFTTLAGAGVRRRVLGFIPLTDNMSGPDALKPGDVVRTYDGKTIEVLDTDNEGRVVLADAIARAAETKPDMLLDVATLTGSLFVSLGRTIAGLFANDDGAAAQVEAAAAATGERVWRLPLDDELSGDLKSSIADLQNATELMLHPNLAAAFLREFVPKGQPWAHVDFASPSWVDRPRHEHPGDATGFGVRLLLDVLQR